MDAPSKNTEGITFLGGSLYVIARDDFVDKLFKISASTGAITQTFDLGSTAQIFDEMGGITNDGTNLVLHVKGFNDIFVLSPTTGDKAGIEKAFPCCPLNSGARGFAFNSNRSQFFGAKNDRVSIYDSNLILVDEKDVTQTDGSISGIQGMTLDGDVLYMAHSGSGKVSKSFLAVTVTTKPEGLAFTSSTSGRGTALWVLVDSEPFDKLLKVNPISGGLISSFGTNGFVDAPSKDTEGITFLDTGNISTSFLWIVANETVGCCDNATKLFKINASTGALVSSFNLRNTASIFSDLGGITNDGTNLLVYPEDNNDIIVLDTTGNEVERTFLCCPFVFGARGFAFNSVQSQFFAAKSKTLLTIDSNRQTATDEETLLLDGSTFSGTVQGMTFDQDVLYVARDVAGTGRISVGAVRKTVGTDPRGLAFSPTGSVLAGSPIGRALWALVDGDPLDVVVKMDADDGSLLANFDAPSKTTSGITFLANHLWIMSEFGDRVLYKINPITGATVSTFNLSSFPSGFVFDSIGGVSNDGTDLLLFAETFNKVTVVDTSGDKVSESFPGGITQGARGVAFRTSDSGLFAGKGAKVTQYTTDPGGSFSFADEFDLSAALTGIQGMTFDPGATSGPLDDVLFIAHTGSGKISKTGVPSGASNKPLGMTYDAAADELYILVDGRGKNNDQIIVMSPAPSGSPTIIRDFAAPSNESDAITFLNGDLHVAFFPQEQFPQCCASSISKVTSDTGAVLDTQNLADSNVFNRITGLSHDGTDLIGVGEFGSEVFFFDPNDGDVNERRFFFDPFDFQAFFDGFGALAFETSTKEFLPIDIRDVFRFDEDARLIDEFFITRSLSN